MNTRSTLAVALAAGFLSIPVAMAQTTTTAPATPGTAMPSTGSTGTGSAPTASTGKSTHSMHYMAMHPSKGHVTHAVMRGHMSARSASSHDSGDAAVDALNAQSLARAKGNPAQ